MVFYCKLWYWMVPTSCIDTSKTDEFPNKFRGEVGSIMILIFLSWTHCFCCWASPPLWTCSCDSIIHCCSPPHNSLSISYIIVIVIIVVVPLTRPDQTRPDFNLADLILELVFVCPWIGKGGIKKRCKTLSFGKTVSVLSVWLSAFMDVGIEP